MSTEFRWVFAGLVGRALGAALAMALAVGTKAGQVDEWMGDEAAD